MPDIKDFSHLAAMRYCITLHASSKYHGQLRLKSELIFRLMDDGLLSKGSFGFSASKTMIVTTRYSYTYKLITEKIVGNHWFPMFDSTIGSEVSYAQYRMLELIFKLRSSKSYYKIKKLYENYDETVILQQCIASELSSLEL